MPPAPDPRAEQSGRLPAPRLQYPTTRLPYQTPPPKRTHTRGDCRIQVPLRPHHTR